MSTYGFDKSCGLPATTALPRLATFFVGKGYEVVAKSATEVSLFYQAGSSTALRLDEHKHRLSLKCDGRKVTFTFAGVLANDGKHDDLERAELERRADEAMASLTGASPSSASGARRCHACGTMSEPNAAACEVCGTHL